MKIHGGLVEVIMVGGMVLVFDYLGFSDIVLFAEKVYRFWFA